jgi:hypothetical protein
MRSAIVRLSWSSKTVGMLPTLIFVSVVVAVRWPVSALNGPSVYNRSDCLLFGVLAFALLGGIGGAA